MEMTRRNFGKGALLLLLLGGAAVVGCGANLGTEPVIIEVPDWFNYGGNQHDLFRHTQNGTPSVSTEFYIRTDSGWERPPTNRFQTLDAQGHWRPARAGDEGPNAWVYYPVPGETYLFTPLLEEHVA